MKSRLRRHTDMMTLAALIGFSVAGILVLQVPAVDRIWVSFCDRHLTVAPLGFKGWRTDEEEPESVEEPEVIETPDFVIGMGRVLGGKVGAAAHVQHVGGWRNERGWYTYPLASEVVGGEMRIGETRIG